MEIKDLEIRHTLSDHFQKALLGNFPFAAWMKDKEERYLAANDKLAEYLGVDSPDLLIGKTIHDFFAEEVASVISTEVQDVLTSGNTIHVEKEFAVKGGNRCFDIYQTPVIIDGELVGMVGCAWDITERKTVEKALVESEERYRRVVEVFPEAIFIHCDGRFVFMNQTAASLLGAERPEDLYGMRALDFVHPDMRDIVSQRIRNAWLHHDNPLIEEELVRLDGSSVYVEMISAHFTYQGEAAVLAIARDISERKKVQDALVRTQKLESLGVLAGGIAHDFNNILMAIIGNADLAMMNVNPESPVIENLRRIEQAAAKAADLAKQMLAYSGKGKFVIEQINLSRLLEEMMHILEVSISKNATLRLNLQPDLPSIEADATQIRQVVMNLILNASEAIGDEGGIITVTTGCVHCGPGSLKGVWLIENLEEGRYVSIEIADTGCGMDKETAQKIFEPFFTTKFTGRGLGLAAVLGIVRGHKGTINIYSEPGKGTAFKILLPVSRKSATTMDTGSQGDSGQCSGTILLADDEEDVRNIGSEMLKALGFSVITANDGRATVDAYRSHPEVDLIILDLTMPRMDGEQCFRELRRINPDINVLVSSGFNEQEVTRKFAGRGLAGFIQKPYNLQALKEATNKFFQQCSSIR